MYWKTHFLSYTLLGVLLVGAPHPSAGQKKNDYPVITYEFGKIIEGLPYGRKFYICGPLQGFNHPRATVVILDIYEIDASVEEEIASSTKSSLKPGDKNHVYNGYFWDDLEKPAATAKFEIFVDRPLKLEQRYLLNFQFFNSDTIIHSQDIIFAFRSVLESLYAKTNYIDSNDLDIALREFQRKLSDRYGFGVLDYDRYANLVLSFEKIDLITFPIQTPTGPVTEEEFLNLVQAHYRLKSLTIVIQKKQNELQVLSRSDEYERLTDALHRPIQTEPEESTSLPGIEKARYDQRDIEALMTFVETKNLQDNSPFEAFIYLFEDGGLSTSNLKTLKQLSFLYDDLESLQENIPRLAKEISRLEDKMGEMDQIIVRGFQLTSNTRSLTSPEVFTKTQLHNLRVGTTAAGSLAALNAAGVNSGTPQMDPFSYAGFKFFFRPVDKGLPNPYLAGPRPWNKMSFVLGAQLGNDLEFRGDNLTDLFGVKPVLGLSYDISPFLSIELGSIFFEQLSTNPLLPEKKPRVAPFFSISLDPDLLNRSKKILANEPYKLPAE